jgi:hypothetical protein
MSNGIYSAQPSTTTNEKRLSALLDLHIPQPAIWRTFLVPRGRRWRARRRDMDATCNANTLKLLALNGGQQIAYLLAKPLIWANIHSPWMRSRTPLDCLQLAYPKPRRSLFGAAQKGRRDRSCSPAISSTAARTRRRFSIGLSPPSSRTWEASISSARSRLRWSRRSPVLPSR